MHGVMGESENQNCSSAYSSLTNSTNELVVGVSEAMTVGVPGHSGHSSSSRSCSSSASGTSGGSASPCSSTADMIHNNVSPKRHHPKVRAFCVTVTARIFLWLSFIRVFQIWQNFPATFVGHYLTRQRWWHPVLDDWRWEYEADKHPKLAGILYLKMIIFVRRLQLHRPGSHSQCLSISPNWVLSYLSH